MRCPVAPVVAAIEHAGQRLPPLLAVCLTVLAHGHTSNLAATAETGLVASNLV